MIRLTDGVLFEVPLEPSDEIDAAPEVDPSEFQSLKTELLEARKEAEILRTLLASKSSQLARLGGRT